MQEKIIQFLKETDTYLSGEEISRALNISRAGIWKYMQDLRDKGYDIVAVPHLGYKLISSPDKLFPHEIQRDLRTKILGKKIIYFDTVNSTMDVAFNLGLQGAHDGTVVCSEGQARGRGRLGRNWISPKGKGIYLSILLRPKVSSTEVAKLTLLCAVSICEAVKEISGIACMIKWPNDILINGKKVAGILTELNAELDRVKFVVVGIGINVNSSASSLPSTATSLKNISHRALCRVSLAKEILRAIEKNAI